jgi:hypothetical protein
MNIMILSNTYTMPNIEVTVILFAYIENTAGEDVNIWNFITASGHIISHVTNGAKLKK